jgi:hypothetical protein
MSGNEIALTVIAMITVLSLLFSFIMGRWMGVPHEER